MIHRKVGESESCLRRMKDAFAVQRELLTGTGSWEDDSGRESITITRCRGCGANRIRIQGAYHHAMDIHVRSCDYDHTSARTAIHYQSRFVSR